MKNYNETLKRTLKNLTTYIEKKYPDTHKDFSLQALPDVGLAHWHFTLTQKGEAEKILRLPKQSQMYLSPQENLDYEESCYRLAEASKATPKFYESWAVDEELLPWGSLVIEKIKGRGVNLKEDYNKIARCLASIHSLSLSKKIITETPIFKPGSALKEMLKEVLTQAAYIDQATISQPVKSLLHHLVRGAEKKALELENQTSFNHASNKFLTTLIAFDAHPGNYIIDQKGSAILVDLEKCRFSYPGFDLAHASLYTSTTWGKSSKEKKENTLTLAETSEFYKTWLSNFTELYSKNRNLNQEKTLEEVKKSILPTFSICRELMWLWSATWCTKWLVESKVDAQAEAKLKAGKEAKVDDSEKKELGQNWSADLTDQKQIDIIKENVLDYLSQENLEMISDKNKKQFFEI